MKKILAWHFTGLDRRLGYDANHLEVAPGYIYSIGDHETPSLCKCGMHASRKAIDALDYAPGAYVWRVRLWGDVKEDDDKLVARHREVLAGADATRVLHEFACWCVRHTPLGDGRVVWDLLTDERSRQAVEIKEAWLAGKATDQILNEAWAAAGDAAGDAAWDAAVAAQNAELERRLKALLRKESINA